jgi:hypothetical protein
MLSGFATTASADVMRASGSVIAASAPQFADALLGVAGGCAGALAAAARMINVGSTGPACSATP